jgi:CubicO group peptidase (beta-lactamase class C family)
MVGVSGKQNASPKLRWLTVVLLVAFYSLLSVGESSKATRFAELLKSYAKYGFLNGSVLVADHGKIIYAQGFGEADRNTHAPNTPRTKFGIGSITKQFTAALVLQQVEEGRIRLDATVSEYLPWYRQDTGKRITVEQLLHHTSGLPPDYDAPAFNATVEGATRFEPQPFVEKFCESNLNAEPGARWQYSNCGYDILGLILERVTGVSYEELLRKKLLEPAGMRDSGLDRNGLPLSIRALGYERHLGPRYVAGPYLDLTHIFSAGAIYSTVEDLTRWNQAMSSDAVLPKAIREQIFHPGLGDWGYGWFVTKIPAGQPGAGSTVAEMRGDMPGNFFSSISRYPEQDALIVVLRNGYGSSERLEGNLQAVLFDQNPHLPWRKPADIIVGACYSTAEGVHGHRLFAALAAVLFLVLVVCLRQRTARASHSHL